MNRVTETWRQWFNRKVTYLGNSLNMEGEEDATDRKINTTDEIFNKKVHHSQR